MDIENKIDTKEKYKEATDLKLINFVKEITELDQVYKWENTDQLSDYLNEILQKEFTENLNDFEILISNKFQQFCLALRQNDQFAKFVVSFITPKIQIFVQQYPNIISSILLALIELASKVCFCLYQS